MIAIDIFKGNHRFSEQTRHPGLDSVVGAANLAPGRHCRRTRITTRQKAGEELSWQIFMSSTRGEDNDGQLCYSANDGTNWTADTQVQNVGMSGSPWAVLWAGGISVFHHGFGNNGSLWYSYFDGTNWYPDTLVPNLSISGSPSCVVR